jgi:hypothetical protein
MTIFEPARVIFYKDADRPDEDDTYASNYDRVEILENGWIACGSEPHGPILFPPHRVKEVDAGYDG